MASAQVLRKQEHLQAGKRRLEEFRKKKAAEKAKKTATASQTDVSASSEAQKQPVDSGDVRLTDFDGAGTSSRSNGPVEPLVDAKNERDVIDITKIVGESSLKAKVSSSTSLDCYSASSGDIARTNSSDHEIKTFDTRRFSGSAYFNNNISTDGIDDDTVTYAESQGRLYGFASDYSTVHHTPAGQSVDNISSESSLYRTQSKENNYFSDNSVNSELQTKINNSGPEVLVGNSFQPVTNFTLSKIEPKEDINGSMHFNAGVNSNSMDINSNGLTSNWFSGNGVSVQKSESTSFGSDSWRSSNSVPLNSASSEGYPRRSRPSFLDSISLSRTSPGMSFQQTDSGKEPLPSVSISNGTDVQGTQPFPYSLPKKETVGPLPNSTHSLGGFEESMNLVSSGKGDLPRFNMNEISTERTHDFYSSKPNEDFAALEQHIEDLTQEKFSMQRALEASRALSESLATENSSLTDSYNQQRIVVNQLKSEMEKLQEEIKVYLVELESMKMEYANAQLECNAADERAKLLASEVIGLEEKALRLRSNELKLERELENSHSEISSIKKKISSLEKDRQDLQSTISALQEEKKLLLSKIRKASASEKSIDAKSPTDKKDMATSTEDLDASPDVSNIGTNDNASFPGSGTSNIPVDQQPGFEDSSVYIPPDQMRMIESISALISDLSMEKEELVKALASESSQCSKLKDLNKELSRKLESQTQRLELLTAKSMANDNIPVRLPESHNNTQENIAYADEGDEVVERVLGWIMKLFPGGPAKRRTSKLV